MFGSHPDGLHVPSLSLGYPQPHVDVRLVGGENANEGVLEVRTPAAMSGYLNLHEKTAEKMSSDGWINTGDIMRRDGDGFFYFVGRDDDMFNCGGENVYPKEVENLLLSHPDVVDACVVALEHRTKGQAPAALVVLRERSSADEKALKQFSLAGGPAYAHPRRIVVQTEPLPLTGARKIDRSGIGRALGERLGVLGD